MLENKEMGEIITPSKILSSSKTEQQSCIIITSKLEILKNQLFNFFVKNNKKIIVQN